MCNIRINFVQISPSRITSVDYVKSDETVNHIVWVNSKQAQREYFIMYIRYTLGRLNVCEIKNMFCISFVVRLFTAK